MNTEHKPAGGGAAVEQTVKLLLRNRYLWLTWLAALYVNLHLSFLQWRNQAFYLREWELFQYLLVVIELALLISALIMLVSTRRTREAWLEKHPGRPFSYTANGLAALLLLPLISLGLIAPLLLLHSYPSEAAAGIGIPLMLLQRLLLITLAVAVSYNLMQLLHGYARLPLWLAGLLGACAHLGLGYWLTHLSHVNERFAPYNDVFIYNQLWLHIDGFPRLDNKTIFSRIDMVADPSLGLSYIGYGLFATLALVAVIITLLLWLPRASNKSRLNAK